MSHRTAGDERQTNHVPVDWRAFALKGLSMKTKGELILNAILPLRDKLRGWQFLFDSERDELEQAAAKYERSRTQLPDDVEVFLQETEAMACGVRSIDPIRELLQEAEETLSDEYIAQCNDPMRIVEIGRKLMVHVREQGAKIETQRRQLRESMDLTDSAQGLAEKTIQECDMLRDRLAKLETCIVCEAALLPPDVPPHCEDSCTVEEEHEAEWEAFRRKLLPGKSADEANQDHDVGCAE